MKIVHLIYSRQMAGAEKYLLDLLPSLKQRNIDCRLICVIPPADTHKFEIFCQELNNRGVETMMLKGTQSSILSLSRAINKYIKDHEIRYVHAHLFTADLLAVIVKTFFNRKLVLLSTKHGYSEAYLNRYPVPPRKPQYNLYYFLSKYMNARIDEQVTISKAMADLYDDLKLTKKRMPYIHHGISIHTPAITPAPKLSAKQLIIVGRIEKMKGHAYLFRAMPAIVKRNPDVQLLVLGDGTEKESLVTLAKTLGVENNIRFMGFQENPYGYVSQSDVIILPSIFEPFGLVYIEAFALKVPVVAFDTQACNEIVTDNETGLLAPLFDSNGLSARVNYLLDNPGERERIAENGYQRYLGYFNTDRMVNETIDWYNSISGGR